MNENIDEKAELFKTIWKVANELRGSVDGWDFKAYVLITLFYRFISEDMANYVSEIEGKSYANLDDEIALNGKDELIKRKGFFIAPSELFSNLIARIKNDKSFAQENLNLVLKKIFENIENSSLGGQSERNFKDIFADFRFDNKALGSSLIEQNKKLARILIAINELNFGNIKQSKIDLFGDAYEYLMRMYASSAGKSGGEYFTPQEVSRLLALLASYNQDEVNKVYDPACGSGSLLLQVAKIYERGGDFQIK